MPSRHRSVSMNRFSQTAVDPLYVMDQISDKKNKEESMTKVCFLVSSLCNEGPVNVMYNIIQYMDFSKFKVSIITFIPEKKTTRIKDFQKYPLSIHQLAPETPLNPFALFTALNKR